MYCILYHLKGKCDAHKIHLNNNPWIKIACYMACIVGPTSGHPANQIMNIYEVNFINVLLTWRELYSCSFCIDVVDVTSCILPSWSLVQCRLLVATVLGFITVFCGTKRNGTERNETERNETKRNETKRNEYKYCRRMLAGKIGLYILHWND